MKWTAYFRPTEHRRLNEFVGLVLVTLAVLIALSLISFDASDPSFNVSRNPEFSARPTNLIGVVGSHASDLLFQTFGLASFLFPLFIGIYAFHWLASWTVRNVGPRIAGSLLMVFTVSAALSLSPIPRIDRQIPSGGGGGELLSDWLQATFNPLGALVVLIAAFFVALLLSTTFTIAGTVEMLGPRISVIGTWKQRFVDYLAEIRKDRTRRRIERKHNLRSSTGTPAPGPLTVEDIKARPAKKRTRNQTDGADAEGDLQRSLIPGMEIAPPVRSELTDVSLADVAFPSPELLLPPGAEIEFDEDELRERGDLIEAKAQEFDVKGQIEHIHPGPIVTTFEFKPEAGIKYAKVTALVDDLCLALEAESIRIERIPGKSTVGMEVPNPEPATIMLRELIESAAYLESNAILPLALGKDIRGNMVISDLHRMPHLLIAGSTGTGKSVSVNTLILSLLFRSRPDRVKLIMIDPKRLELGLYQDIPHLLVPVVTEPHQAQNALKWAVSEMEGRYKKLAKLGVRTLEAYNEQVAQLQVPGLDDAENEYEHLPYIVIVIDELADLMMVASKDVEASITRLAQMARAVGIHLILATQRPSVDVITGLIKANFPARISFRVASKTDSRTILDANGAESLLGRGDMLFLPPGSARLMRAHGPMVTEDEVTRVVDYLKQQGKPAYNESILESPEERRALEPEGGNDALYDTATRLVVAMGKASTSALQRRLRIGYGRAASLLDAMEADGIVGPPEGSRPREILVKPDYFEEIDNRDPEE